MIQKQLISEDFEITPSVRETVEKEVAHLENVLNHEERLVVTLSTESDHHKPVFKVHLRTLAEGKNISSQAVCNRFTTAMHKARHRLQRRTRELKNKKLAKIHHQRNKSNLAPLLF